MSAAMHRSGARTLAGRAEALAVREPRDVPTLVRRDGAWPIVAKVFHFQPRAQAPAATRS